MNLREGTRRLALLLGVAGLIFGGFVSYMELQSVQDQRARHNRFEQLVASDVVQQERKILKAWTPVQETPPKIDANTGVSLDWSKSIPLPSKVNSGGIETINWSHDYGVASIKTFDCVIALARIHHSVGSNSRNRMGGSRIRCSRKVSIFRRTRR